MESTANSSPYEDPLTRYFRNAKRNETQTVANDAVFAVLHHRTGTTASYEASSAGARKFARDEKGTSPSILFMRGHALPEWIDQIGLFGDFTGLFNRHLDSGSFGEPGEQFYSASSLPRPNDQIVSFMFSTIRLVGSAPFNPEIPVNPKYLERRREREDDAMRKFHQETLKKGQPGDSCVQKFYSLSDSHFIIEQKITIQVKYVNDTWKAAVWLDHGEPLLDSHVKGPWSEQVAVYVPTIVELWGNPVISPFISPSETMYSSSPPSSTPFDPVKIGQAIRQLPFQYGTQLDKDLAKNCPVYALGELLHVFASWESQFLNCIERHVDRGASSIDNDVTRNSEFIIANLLFLKKILLRHESDLMDVLSFLVHHVDAGFFPVGHCCALRSQGTRSQGGTKRVLHTLIKDFEYLQATAKRLERRCMEEIDHVGLALRIEALNESSYIQKLVDKALDFFTI
ncbi:hypothetical protein BJX99DRAFT_265257 [Aspergillus californicus]